VIGCTALLCGSSYLCLCAKEHPVWGNKPLTTSRDTCNLTTQPLYVLFKKDDLHGKLQAIELHETQNACIGFRLDYDGLLKEHTQF